MDAGKLARAGLECQLVGKEGFFDIANPSGKKEDPSPAEEEWR